jgi:2,4-dienoyl-CoA reductase-like NADH-dependent reductase (Old Yellow Enzyme family)
VAAHLESGGIDVIICSGGTSSHNPMLLFRGDSMLDGLLEQEKSRVMKLGMKFMGPSMFKEYPYEENFFFDEARRVRDRVQCGVCYIGGTCTSESISGVMDAGFDFIQLGRGLLYDPDMPKHAEADPAYVNGCNHCNKCATLIEAPGGILCVERPDNFAVG